MKIFSIAALTFKAAVRSKMAVTLAVVILLAVFGLPCLLDSDMNPAQSISVALFYTLAAVEVILCIAAVWTGAESFSQDIKFKTFHLLRVKPVALWQAWAGKWLGLVALFASLLFLAFAGMYARIHFLDGGFPESASIASRFISPELPDPAAQIDMLVSLATDEDGQPLKGRELAGYRREVEMQVPFLTDSLSAGQEWNWKFNLPRKVRADRALGFRFKFDSDAVSRDNIRALCTVTSPHRGKSVTFELADFSSREIEVPLESAQFDGEDTIILKILHTGEKGSGSIILQPRQGIFLRQPAASLLENMARSYFVVVSVVALVAALGLTLGAFFTLPVAVFCSVALIATILISNCPIMGQGASHVHYSKEESIVEEIQLKLGDWITDAVVFASEPVYKAEPITRLSSFEYVEDGNVWSAVLGNMVVLPGIFAICSAFALRRKELGE